MLYVLPLWCYTTILGTFWLPLVRSESFTFQTFSSNHVYHKLKAIHLGKPMSATPTQLSLRVKTLPLKNTVNNFVVHKDDLEMSKHWTIPIAWGLTITNFLQLNNVAVTCFSFTGLSELEIKQINDMSGRRWSTDQADRSKKERLEVSLWSGRWILWRAEFECNLRKSEIKFF